VLDVELQIAAVFGSLAMLLIIWFIVRMARASKRAQLDPKSGSATELQSYSGRAKTTTSRM